MSNPRLEKLTVMLQETPDDLFLLYAIGMEYLGLHDKQQAINNFRQVIALDKGYTAAYYQLGKLMSEQNDDKEAIRLYEIGLQLALANNDQRTIREFQSALDELMEI